MREQEAIDDAEYDNDASEDYVTGNGADTDQHTNRVLGGYKATLKNPNVSEEAKEHAREVLEGESEI